MKTAKTFVAIIMATVIILSCKKKPTEPENTPQAQEPTTGSITLEFEAMAGTNTLALNTQTYITANNDTFKVSMFKYYISNIVFTKSDNSTFTEPNSYHLIDHSGSSNPMITISDVPNDDYKAITFMIGVDSTRNVSGAQSGDLDPTKGMFWSWSSGYVMAKIEGTSPQSGATNKALTFHIGGFSGVNKVLKTVSPSFGTSVATVSSNHIPEIHLSTDLLQWFTTPTNINFATQHTVHMPGTLAKTIADNYADMFNVEHIHNN